MKERPGHCPRCQRQVLARTPGVNHVLHVILTLATGCLWAPIWLLMMIQTPVYRCTQCGSTVRPDIFG